MKLDRNNFSFKSQRFFCMLILLLMEYCGLLLRIDVY